MFTPTHNPGISDYTAAYPILIILLAYMSIQVERVSTFLWYSASEAEYHEILPSTF